MQINPINLSNMIIKDTDLLKFQIGQRFQVEVLSNEQNQDGLIALNGKILKAKFTAEVQRGEKFIAQVKEADENGIILSREILSNPKINNLNPNEIILLVNRGLDFDQEIVKLLNRFTGADNLASFLSNHGIDKTKLSNIIMLLWKIIPEWAELNGENFKTLLQYYKSLGLEYEKTLSESLKHSKNSIESDESVPLKMELLKILNSENNSLSAEDKTFLDKLLAEITGQQLWIQTGTRKNAYCLMHFPLQDSGHLYNCRIGIEGARKGTKIDIRHCHIALDVETRNLGLIGADIRIYENNLYIDILHDDKIDLSLLRDQIYAEAADNFNRLGLSLKQMALKTYNDSPNFSSFISGKFIGGVDIKG